MRFLVSRRAESKFGIVDLSFGLTPFGRVPGFGLQIVEYRMRSEIYNEFSRDRDRREESWRNPHRLPVQSRVRARCSL